ncbi:MAG: SURF1 family protein [Afipia sp.]|nr:SURF1 family protein [Afipia sp.]
MKRAKKKAAPRSRSIAGLAVIVLVTIAVLISLGIWQLHRKDEKHALIAALTQRLAAAPIALPPKSQWQNLYPGHDEFTRVTFEATMDTRPDAKVFSSGSALRTDISGLGTFVFVPARLRDGSVVVVDRGFVSDGSNAEPILLQVFRLTGYIRFPEKAGWFTPHEEAAKRLWFVRDHLAMAKANDWGEVAPFYVDLESSVPASALPKAGPLQVHLKDDHLQYAITWFALALAVAATFGFWIAAQRRR